MYDYYRGSSSYEDAVKRQLTGIEATNVASTRALHEMNSNLRSAFQETNNIMKAGFGATLAMEAEIGNAMVAGFDATNNAIQNMAFGVTSAIRESTYDIVASQAMLAQTFTHGFNAVNNTLNLGFSMVNSKLDVITDRICSELNEIHDTLKNPLFTANQELYRRAYGNYEKGLYEEALEDFTGAVEKDKTNWVAWYFIGCIYLFGAGKFCNVINVDKAEEAFFNAAKYIDYDLGKSDEANRLGSEIYYYLGYARLIKSNDLLVENNNAESVKKMEEAEYASRESYRLSDKNLLALYEQAKELHFLDRDDEALQLIEKLIRTDKNYAVRACNDKNFESLWNRIESLITVLRDELANKLAEEFSTIRALGRKGNEQLADIQFSDEKQVSEFKRFYNSEFIPSEYKADEALIRNICNDFDSLATEKSYGNFYKSVINSDEVIKNVHSEKISWVNEFDSLESNIEREIEPLESALKKENDYFSVRDKYSKFFGSDDNAQISGFVPQRDKLVSMVKHTLEEFDKKYATLKHDAITIQLYLDAQQRWDKKKVELRDKYEDEITKECMELRNSWKSRINELKQQFSKNAVGEKSALETELNIMASRLEEVFESFGNLQGENYYFIAKKYKKLKQERFLQAPSSYFNWSLFELEKKLRA